MRALLFDRLTAIWALLALATVVSVEFVTGIGGGDHRLATILVVGIAFLKVRYVGLDFMEIRHAPLPLRIAFEAWVIVVPVAIIGFYASGLY